MTLALDAVLAPLFSSQHGVISRSQALELGASRHAILARLRSGVWRSLLPGIYLLTGAPPTWKTRLMAAVLYAGPSAAISHRAAAALWALAGFVEGIVELSAPHVIVIPKGHVHRTCEMSPALVTRRDGIPVTTVGRTLVDLCAVASPSRVEGALDSALAAGLASLDHQWRLMNRIGTRGRRGTAALRALVAERMEIGIPGSVAETRFASLLRASRIPGVHRQFEVRDDDGSFVARVDAAWPELRLAIEIHSWKWHTSKERRRHDAHRQNSLERLGWTILIFFWEDIVSDPDYVRFEISAARARLCNEPSIAPPLERLRLDPLQPD